MYQYLEGKGGISSPLRAHSLAHTYPSGDSSTSDGEQPPTLLTLSDPSHSTTYISRLASPVDAYAMGFIGGWGVASNCVYFWLPYSSMRIYITS